MNDAARPFHVFAAREFSHGCHSEPARWTIEDLSLRIVAGLCKDRAARPERRRFNNAQQRREAPLFGRQIENMLEQSDLLPVPEPR